jgi:hypothetical protein
MASYWSVSYSEGSDENPRDARSQTIVWKVDREWSTGGRMATIMNNINMLCN